MHTKVIARLRNLAQRKLDAASVHLSALLRYESLSNSRTENSHWRMIAVGRFKSSIGPVPITALAANKTYVKSVLLANMHHQ